MMIHKLFHLNFLSNLNFYNFLFLVCHLETKSKIFYYPFTDLQSK